MHMVLTKAFYTTAMRHIQHKESNEYKSFLNYEDISQNRSFWSEVVDEFPKSFLTQFFTSVVFWLFGHMLSIFTLTIDNFYSWSIKALESMSDTIMIISTVAIAAATVVYALVAIFQWRENKNLFKITLVAYLSELLGESMKDGVRTRKRKFTENDYDELYRFKGAILRRYFEGDLKKINKIVSELEKDDENDGLNESERTTLAQVKEYEKSHNN